ncbi:MAG: acetate--CoA ligase family protein, partial [Proteobacteria bacterium]|nr:acetate--CoA ligase family protein [Pseudomonadota bacterium]
MKIHEYQSKELLRKHGIAVPEGYIATDPEGACRAAEKLSGFPIMVKAQIHAGGRGKGGGVRISRNLDEVLENALTLLSKSLVTPQTGPQGKRVRKLLVEQGVAISRELYLSIIPDRATAKIMVIASEAGGMDIEEVASQTPEKILRTEINPLTGIKEHHGLSVAQGLNLSGSVSEKFVEFLNRLYG